MIGRSDERVNPGRATAVTGRSIVVVSFAEPIWASGHGAASKAGHMTAIASYIRSRSFPLASQGSSTHARRIVHHCAPLPVGFHQRSALRRRRADAATGREVGELLHRPRLDRHVGEAADARLRGLLGPQVGRDHDQVRLPRDRLGDRIRLVPPRLRQRNGCGIGRDGARIGHTLAMPDQPPTSPQSFQATWTFRGRPPSLPFSREAAVLADVRLRPPVAPS